MEKFTENQKYSNLFHILHFYLKNAVVKNNKQNRIRAKFEKTTKIAKQIKFESANFRHKKYKNNNESSPKTNPYCSHLYKPHCISTSQHNDK